MKLIPSTRLGAAVVSVAGIAAAAGLSGGGYALASTSSPAASIPAADNQMFACVTYNPATHVPRTIQDAYTSKSNFLAWLAKQPGQACPDSGFAVGLAGGAPGATGAAGPQGTPGLSNLQADEPYGQDSDPNANITQSSGLVPAGQTAVVWAACPSGKTAISGGFRIGNTAAESDTSQATNTADDEQVIASEATYYNSTAKSLDLSSAPQATSYGSYVPNAWAVTVHNDGTSDQRARVQVICATVASGS